MRERRRRHASPLREATVQKELAWFRKNLCERMPKGGGDLLRQIIFAERYPDHDEVWRFWARCEGIRGDLGEFLDFEDGAAEVALPSLLGTLRGRDHYSVEVGVLAMIADMLDPDKPGRWKLELRRNVRGAPSEHRGSYYHWIAMEYFELLEELKAEGVRSPAKETTRRLIKRFEWSTNDIRTAVQWWRKRGLTLKR